MRWIIASQTYHHLSRILTMTQREYTLSWMSFLVRASFHSQQANLIYRSFVQRLWQEMEKAQVPSLVVQSKDERTFNECPHFLFGLGPMVRTSLSFCAFHGCPAQS